MSFRIDVLSLKFSVVISSFLLLLFSSSCKKELVDDEAKKPNIQYDYLFESNEFTMAVDFEMKMALVYDGDGIIDRSEFQSFLKSNSIFRLDSDASNLVTGETYTLQVEEEFYSLYLTTRPLILLQSNLPIQDEPKVLGDLILIEENHRMESKIGIEYRGQTSLVYDKKSLSIELWDNDNGDSKRKESLLGMRIDDDWIIDAMGNDPLRMRNPISLKIWHDKLLHYHDQEGALGVDSRFVEYFVNGSYQGIGGLMERVDRKLLQLKEYEGNIRGELYKADDWTSVTLFSGVSPFDNSSEWWASQKYKYPDPDDVIDWSPLYDFVDFVANSNDADFIDSIHEKLNLDNAIDYYIYLNLTQAYDNRGKNLYTAKYDFDQPYFFIPWDLDGSWGLFYDGTNLTDPQEILSNNLFDRLIELNPEDYINRLKNRWLEVKNDEFNWNEIEEVFALEFNRNISEKLYEREWLKWPTHPIHFEEGDFQHFIDYNMERQSVLDSYFMNL